MKKVLARKYFGAPKVKPIIVKLKLQSLLHHSVGGVGTALK
jgi:hypothetical protein